MAYGNENTQNQGLTSEGNQSENTTNASTPIPLSISGSEQNFDLKKKVISNVFQFLNSKSEYTIVKSN